MLPKFQGLLERGRGEGKEREVHIVSLYGFPNVGDECKQFISLPEMADLKKITKVIVLHFTRKLP